MEKDCVFCRIAAGELPCAKVYEDGEVLAFMDIGPVVKGHTLVIPKQHHDPITRTPLPVLQKVVAAVQQVARAQETALRADGINVTQANGRIAGQVIPHLHFHVIPRFNGDAHSWHAPQGKYDTPQEMEQFAARIRGGMAG